MSFLFDDEADQAPRRRPGPSRPAPDEPLATDPADDGAREASERNGAVATRRRSSRDDEVDDDPPERIERDRSERRPHWGRRILVVLGLLLVLGLVGAAAGARWVQGKVDPGGEPGEQLAITIPEGATTTDVAEILADAGVVSDARVFRYYVRFRADDATFDAGDYTLQENSAMGDVVTTLGEGPALAAARANVLVQEGLSLAEVATRVGEQGLDGNVFLFLAGSGGVTSTYSPPGNTNLEGLLFPETYRLEEGEGEEQLLRRMVETLDSTATELGYFGAEGRVGVSAYEVLIIASLIEEEARVDQDRARIARVIYNRLEQGMTLGIDATVYYAVGKPGGVALTQSDLDTDSPYNTRLNPGLPPTPIAMPGRASMEAALNPAEGPELFYVLADPCGLHAFSDNIQQFNRDVAAARERGLLDPSTPITGECPPGA